MSRELDPKPTPREPSSASGMMLFAMAGVAVGAGAGLMVYRRPLESVRFLERLKLHAFGIRGREILTSGQRIWYWAGGDWSSTAIVLIHDPFSASETWHRIMPRIARSFRVLAPDLPGFGRSPEPVDVSVASLGRSLVGFLQEEGVETAILVGSSLGGLVAAEAALQAPELVRGLIVSDPIGVGGDLPNPGVIIHRGRPDVDVMLHKAFHSPPPIPAFVRDEMVIRSQTPTLRLLLSDVPEAGARIAESVGGLSIPTLVLWGDNDDVVPLDEGERLNAVIPGSRLVRISQCGHLPHREAPDLFYEIIMDFLAGPTPDQLDGYDL